MRQHDNGWWGEFTLNVGGKAYWRIGPLEMWAERTDHEWRFAQRRGDDPLDTTVSIECPGERNVPANSVDHRRFGFKTSAETISLTPVLAPRGVIVKPEVSFSLPPKQEATLYVSSPLWIEIKSEKPAATLFETPTFRPSDTWFGPSTLVGELCYAARTRARSWFPDGILPARAISAIQIRNSAPSLLNFERIKLPTPNLSVYADASGQLWTEQVTLDREEDGDFAALRLGKGPQDGVKSELLRGPRVRIERGLSMRSFGGIFK